METAEPVGFGQVLSNRAQRDPEALAFAFLNDSGEREEISFGKLQERALAWAGLIGERGLSGRAVLLFPPGIEYIAALFGCFYGGLVAVPAYPPTGLSQKRALARLGAIIADAQPSALLTEAAIHEPVVQFIEGLAGTEGISVLSRADGIAAGSETGEEPSHDDIALLQYTSGATASPRGVKLTHENLLTNSRFIASAFGHSSESRGVIWLPPYHDMGLIGGILQPVYVGFPCLLMSPLTFLSRPAVWLTAITEFGGTTSGGPNFAFEFCVRRISEEDRAQLDLSSWELAFNGSERIRRNTLEAFSQSFAACGFRPEAFFPCYGLAEGTLMVTGGIKSQLPRSVLASNESVQQGKTIELSDSSEGSIAVVSCGSAAPDHEVTVVDPASCAEVEDGTVGEIWVRGPSVARGYWCRDDETGATFHAHRSDEPTEKSYLRTGDLGFFWDGELHVTGRLKDLILVGGQNFYPVDVEEACEQVGGSIRRGCSAAFSIEGEDEEQVVLVAEVRDSDELDSAVLIQDMRVRVTRETGLALDSIVLVAPRSVPKTPSGKVQRADCRSLHLDGEFEVIAEWTSATPTEAVG